MGSEVPGMDRRKEGNPREWVAKSILEGVEGKIPKGELCIDDSLIQKGTGCDRVGFAEQYAFALRMNLEVFTLSPVYPRQGKRLPAPGEVLWPDLREWTTGTSLFVFALLDGAFEWGLRTMGFQDFLLLPRSSPLLLDGFIRSVEDLNREVIRFLAANGVNGIILADDIAFSKGLMLQPSLLRKHFFPSLANQVAEAADCGLPVFYHSDGRYRDVVEDVITAGFTGLHCVDRASGMDIEELQAQVGDRLCLWGHLDAGDTEKARDPLTRRDLVALIRKLAAGKRFILGTNSGLFEGLDIEGLRELYHTVDGPA